MAASRQAWEFSRDGALPFSAFFRKVISHVRYQPVRAVWECVISAVTLGLLCLINPVAANAPFSMAITGNNLAWSIPIFSRIMGGQTKFTAGAFYTGGFSTAIVLAVAYNLFAITLSIFPTTGPSPAGMLRTFSSRVYFPKSTGLKTC